MTEMLSWPAKTASSGVKGLCIQLIRSVTPSVTPFARDEDRLSKKTAIFFRCNKVKKEKKERKRKEKERKGEKEGKGGKQIINSD